MGKAESVGSTREAILGAAEDLFARQGYTATTIAEVASTVGIQGPAIYKHFASKRALFDEVLERVFAPFLALVQIEETRAGNLEAIVQRHLDNPNAARIVQHATLSGGEDFTLLVERWYRPFFADLQEQQAAPASGTAANGKQWRRSAVRISAFHSLLLGYLSLAPLHAAVLGYEPLEAKSIAELLALQSQLAQQVDW